MIRQADIAKRLNISRTTVGRALNDSGSINVETKEKILKMCDELGYSKNPISTSLASKKKKNIYAFIVRTKKDYYINQIKCGFLKAQNEFKFYKYEINIIETNIDYPEKQLEEIKRIIDKRNVDGIIVTPLLKDEISILRKNNPKIFFIALDLALDNNTYNIYSNYHKSGRVTAEVLQSLLKQNDNILLIDTEDDRISSKLLYDGFYTKIKEDKKCNIIGPVYQSNLKYNIYKVIEENLSKDIKAIYSSRFLDDIVDFIDENNYIDLKVVGNGLENRTKELIKKKRIVATISESYLDLGYLACTSMFEYLYKGIEPKYKNIQLESKIVFRENLLY